MKQMGLRFISKKVFNIGIVISLMLGLTGTVLAAAPILNDQTFSVAENSATGTFVGDADPADSATTYTITAGNASGAFTINPANGDISVADGTQINYEAANQFVLTVEATNTDGSDTAAVTINVININDAPQITPGQSFSIAENSSSGTAVGTVAASDPDPGNVLTYQIIAGNTGNAFMINASTGEIQVQTSSVLDFESGPTSYDLIVSVSDGGLSDTDVVTITVTDANDAPAAVADGPYAASEDTQLVVPAAGVLANDSDQDGDGLTAVLATQANNGTVTLNSDGSFTYDPAPGFNGTDTFTYYANDGTADSNTVTVTIDVAGSNDAPTANDDAFGPVAEDSTMNITAPGVLGNDTDPENDPLQVSASDNSSSQGAVVTVNADGSFSYDPTAAAALQALPQGGSTTDSFTYTANDGSLDSLPATVSITVTGVNDPPTVNDAAFSIAEDTANSSVVGTPVSNDVDTGDVLTFSILSGNTGNAFAISSPAGEITVNDNTALDFETTPVMTLIIQVEDGSSAADTATVTITVTDANDAPTDISLDNASVPENSLPGTAVGNFSTTDQDSGDTFTYSLASGTGDTGNSSFQIVGNELQTNASFDYEAQNSYSIRVRSTDNGGLWFEKVLTISVTDVNEAPTAIALDNASVLEEQPAGTAVGNFSTTDPDSGSTFTYSLVSGGGSAGNSFFKIVGNELQTDAILDYETQPVYSIRVRSTDNGGLWVEQQFTINVTDGNDAPTDISLSNTTVDENQASGAVVGILSGTDPNPGDTLTFSLVSGAVDNSSFAINGTNLETAVSFDFESNPSLTVRVRVTDQGGLFYDEDFIVTINDLNDAPTNISLDNASIGEGNSVGDPVGNFSTTDQDAGDTFTYVLTDTASFPDNGSFQIVGGQLQANAVFDFEAQNSYAVRVRSTDSGGLWTEKTLNISITNVNDAPTDITLSNDTVDENLLGGATVGSLTAVDPDSGDSHTFSLVPGAVDNDQFVINLGTNILMTGVSFNYETQNSYTIRVEANDGHGGTYQKDFVINIADVNDAPTAVNDTGYIIDEDNTLNVPANGVLANDSDEDGDSVFVSANDPASAEGAVVTVAADGSFSYDPTGATSLQALGIGESAADSFAYTADDGNGGTTSAIVSVTVNGVNDAPTAQDDTAYTAKDTAVIINVRSNDIDPDTNDTLTITAVTQGSKGSVTHDGSTITYTPNIGAEGDDSFSYTIDDGHGSTDTAVVNVQIGLYQLYLPMITKPAPAVSAPDLVVTNINATSSEVQVTISNQGNVATASGFWVDFYVDPNPVPTHANQLWDDLGSEGIAWGVTIPINPGESLTLVYSTVSGAPNTYVSEVDTHFTGSMAAGTAVYAQVDSAHVGHVNGAIEEIHEILGDAYNNVSQMYTSSALGNAAETAVFQSAESEAKFDLPIR